MSYHEKGYHRVNRIVTTIFDGRTVAKGVTVYGCTPVNCLGNSIYVEVTIPNLDFIEEILNVQIHTKPSLADLQDGLPVNCPILGNKTIIGNVLGITICNVADGITATVEAIAIGV